MHLLSVGMNIKGGCYSSSIKSRERSGDYQKISLGKRSALAPHASRIVAKNPSQQKYRRHTSDRNSQGARQQLATTTTRRAQLRRANSPIHAPEQFSD